MPKPRITVVGLIFVALGVAASAGATEDESLSRAQTLAAQVDRIRAHLNSAEGKFNKGVVGMGQSAAGGVASIGQSCCAGNLRNVNEAVTKIKSVLEALSHCYEATGDPVGVDALSLASTDTRSVETAARVLLNAPDRETMQGAFAGSKRAYFQLKQSTEILPPCSTPAATKDADQPKKKKKKKEKKSKQKADG